MKIISTMNQAFKEYYYSGELNRLCKVSITMGNDSYRHEMSAIFLEVDLKSPLRMILIYRILK